MGCRPNFLKTMKALERLNQEIIDKDLILDKPYGGGNPYFYCPSCKRSNVEYSTNGHFKGCEKEKLDREAKALSKKIESQFKTFMDKREFESTSFKNYLWFVNYSFPFYMVEDYVRDLSYENKMINEQIYTGSPINKDNLISSVNKNKELIESINNFLKNNKKH